MSNPITLAALSLLLAPLAREADMPPVSADTGTQGADHWQFEFGVTQTPRQDDVGRQRLWDGTLTYGLTDPLDIYLDAPYTTSSGAPGSGWNDAGIGLKWRFVDQKVFKLAIKPEITFPTGDWQRGLGNGRTGGSATLLAQWEVEPFTLLANAGLAYQPNGMDQRSMLWQFSGAALYHATEQLQLALDAVVTRNATPGVGTSPAFLIAAVIYSPKSWLDLDIGYRYGLNSQTDNHALMAGLTARW
jgi:hypothetical protein